MKLLKDYGYVEGKIIRYGMTLIIDSGRDSQWYIDNYPNELEAIRLRDTESLHLEKSSNTRVKKEITLKSVAEEFMQRQFMHPYAKTLDGIETLVDDEIIAIACAESALSGHDKALHIRSLASSSQSATIKSYLRGYKKQLTKNKLKDVSNDDLMRIAIANPMALLYISRETVGAIHWNTGSLIDRDLVKFSPSSKIDEVIFRDALGQDNLALATFLSIPGNYLTDIKDLNKEQMLKLSIHQKFSVGSGIDYFNKDDVLFIIKNNPSAIGDCSFVGYDEDIDKAVLIALELNPEINPALAVSKVRTDLLNEFFLSDSRVTKHTIRNELIVRGADIYHSDDQLNHESESHVDYFVEQMRKEEHGQRVVNEDCPEWEAVNEGIQQIRSDGMDEQWYIDNFPGQLRRIMLEHDMGMVGENENWVAKEGEHPLFHAAKYFIENQFSEPYAPERFGIPVNLPESFLIKMALIKSDDFVLIENPDDEGVLDGTVYDLIRGSNSLMEKLYLAGFDYYVGKVHGSSKSTVESIAVRNPAALEYFTSDNISKKDYETAFLASGCMVKLMPLRDFNPILIEGVICSGRMPSTHYINKEELGGTSLINSNALLRAFIFNDYSIDEAAGILDKNNIIKLIYANSNSILGENTLGNDIDIDIAAFSTSYQSDSLHNYTIKSASKKAIIEADRLDLINYPIIGKNIADFTPPFIARKILKYGSREFEICEDVPF